MEYNELQQMYTLKCEQCEQHQKEIKSLQVELLTQIALVEKLSLDNERLVYEKSIQRFFNKEGIILVFKVIMRKILSPIRKVITFFI